MKRIVKITKQNGKTEYKVEENTIFFGLIRTKWHLCTMQKLLSDNSIGYFPSIFDSLKEAEIFCGEEVNPSIKEEIIKYYK